MAGKQHPTIKAVIDQKYRLPDLAMAQERLATLKKHFVHSKEQPDAAELCLWIREFAVTTAEKKKGFLGHYATIRIRKSSAGYYTLTAEKETVELAKHPQRKRPKQNHPDWGHPVLRNAKRGKSHMSVEAAQAQLDKLHTAFPKVTIPTNGALHVIIYGSQKGSNAKTHKYTLKIETTPEGFFVIKPVRNEHQRRKENTPQKKASDVKGQFTAQVLLKKKRKNWA